MSGSTVTANNFFAFHTVLKTSEDYYEAMRWARRLANNISDTINRNVSGMYFIVWPQWWSFAEVLAKKSVKEK